MHPVERTIETVIFNSRWLMAPFYLGLIVALVLLFIKFATELLGVVVNIGATNESETILAVLTLIDLTFTGNLVLIVIFAGYENFVSKIEAGEHDRPDWMTKVDFSGLKQKLLTSIMAISTIQVLKAFMNLNYTTDTSKFGWLIGMHMVFLASMLLLAISERIVDHSTREHLSKPEGETLTPPKPKR